MSGQISRIQEIYVTIRKNPSLDNCDEVKGFIEAAFGTIQQKTSEPLLRDIAILFYMGIIESLELVSFQLSQFAAVQMPDKKYDNWFGKILMSQKQSEHCICK